MPPGPSPAPDWAAIYAEHGHAMWLAARGVIGGQLTLDKEAHGKSADDVVGDVIAELMPKGLPQKQSNLRGFLTAVTRRRAIDAVRRAKHEAPTDIDFEEIVGVEGIEDTVDRELLTATAVDALDALPERERYAIEQTVMLQRQAKDVGPELNVTPQRVSQLVSQGIRRLRELPAFSDLLPADLLEPGQSTTTGPDMTGRPS